MSLLIANITASYLQGGAAPPTFTPNSIDNCIFWLDSTDSSTITQSGNLVSQWLDKSTNGGYVMTASTTKPTYHVNGFGSLSAPYLSSDATQYMMSNSDFGGAPMSGDALFTIFIVFSAASLNASGNYLTGWGTAGTGTDPGIYYDSGNTPISFGFGGGENYKTTTPLATSTNYIYTYQKTTIGPIDTNSLLRINGIQLSAAASSGTTPNANTAGPIGIFCWGDFTSQPWNGSIASVVIYSSALTTAQIVQVETYLNGLYGVY